jgi:hypothetical protein
MPYKPLKIDNDYPERKTVDFGQAIYASVCGECEERIEFEASFDADGTYYHASCCGYSYTIGPPDTAPVYREKE